MKLSSSGAWTKVRMRALSIVLTLTSFSLFLNASANAVEQELFEPRLTQLSVSADKLINAEGNWDGEWAYSLLVAYRTSDGQEKMHIRICRQPDSCEQYDHTFAPGEFNFCLEFLGKCGYVTIKANVAGLGLVDVLLPNSTGGSPVRNCYLPNLNSLVDAFASGAIPGSAGTGVRSGDSIGPWRKYANGGCGFNAINFGLSWVNLN